MNGRLAVGFDLRDGRTELVHLACQPPLQALRAIRRGAAAELVVATLGPGLMGGDRYEVTVEAGAGAQVVVTSQSANRVLPARGGAGVSVAVRLVVGAGAVLEWLPLPTILQAGARYRQDVRVELTEGARAVLMDVLVPGRLAMGERLAFEELDARLVVHGPGGELLVAERQWLRPRGDELCEDAVVGSLFVLGAPPTAGTELPNGAGWFTRVVTRTADEALRALRTAITDGLWAGGLVRETVLRP